MRSSAGDLALPADGAIRIHPHPEALPRLRREGPGRNRFDDPEANFAVRYAADSVLGAATETMARFRPHPPTESVLQEVEGVENYEEPEFVHDPSLGVADWLSQQSVGALKLSAPSPVVLDIEDALLLDILDSDPIVRAALEQSGLGTDSDPVRLDAAIIRLGGPVGRPITQAVSLALHRSTPGLDAIAYWSRLDSTQRCWAIYDHVPVEVVVTPLNPANDSHHSAIGSVAIRFGIDVPSEWL